MHAVKIEILGMDGIVAEALKVLNDGDVGLIQKICSEIWTNGDMSQDWIILYSSLCKKNPTEWVKYY